MERVGEWADRPLDAVYPVIFIDAIVRYEALYYRVEVEGLHCLVVAAVGLKLEAA
jgi:transposase-like protein